MAPHGGPNLALQTARKCRVCSNKYIYVYSSNEVGAIGTWEIHRDMAVNERKSGF